MLRIIFFLVILNSSFIDRLYGQNNDLINNCISPIDTLQGKQVLLIADKMPEFPGGNLMLMRFITKNIKAYSDSSDILQTRVFVTFVVDTLGKCVNECIISPLYKEKFTPLETSALNVIRNLPEWKPAENGGNKVPVRFILPINIEIN